jgi:hypothetical protein
MLIFISSSTVLCWGDFELTTPQFDLHDCHGCCCVPMCLQNLSNARHNLGILTLHILSQTILNPSWHNVNNLL